MRRITEKEFKIWNSICHDENQLVIISDFIIGICSGGLIFGILLHSYANHMKE